MEWSACRELSATTACKPTIQVAIYTRSQIPSRRTDHPPSRARSPLGATDLVDTAVLPRAKVRPLLRTAIYLFSKPSLGEISPEGSSGDSVTSQDDLEMRPSRDHKKQQEPSTSRIHRLAPGNRRRSLDGATDECPPMPHASSSRGPRPPPSIRGFNSIPASAAPPPPFGTLPGPLPQFSHSSAKRTSGSATPPVSSPLASAPVTPSLELGFDFGDFSTPSQSKPPAHTSEYGPRTSSLAGKPHDTHQYHEEPSYFAQEQIEYHNEAQYQIASSPPTLDRRQGSFPMQPSHAVPRSVQPTEVEERKSKKLTKAPSKPKKSRFSWSRPPSASA
jgi:hypothetical protein